MTDGEKALLIEYLVDAGEIFPDLDVDVEAQFLEWHEVRQGVVPGETHYKAIRKPPGCGSGASSRAGSKGCLPHPPTARASATTTLRAVATPRGTLPAWPRATPNAGTTRWKTWLESAGSWTTSTSRRRGYNGGLRLGRSGLVMPISHTKDLKANKRAVPGLEDRRDHGND